MFIANQLLVAPRLKHNYARKVQFLLLSNLMNTIFECPLGRPSIVYFRS